MWIKIEHLHEHIAKGSREMFVVKAFNKVLDYGSVYTTYTSDPYCVWLDSVGGFERWPHAFMPTHFCLLPVERVE